MAVSAFPADSDILNEQRRRLSQLERRAARQGYDTPPEVLNEIVDLRKQVAEVGVPASETERWTLLYDLSRETRADVRRLYVLMPVLMVLLCAFMVLLVRL